MLLLENIYAAIVFVLYTVTPVSLVLAIKASFLIVFDCCNTFSLDFPDLIKSLKKLYILEDGDKITFA